MISILIPVYNTDACQLARALSQQVSVASFKAEIIIMDDASDEQYREINSSVPGLPFITFISLEKNIGRIEIRKKLAYAAQYDWLLFIDGDSEIIAPGYLMQYHQHLTGSMDVIAGGRIYPAKPPTDKKFLLHWKYGSKREKTNKHALSEKNFYGFKSNNFLIRKDVFNKLRLKENFWGYGHEDTLMGIELENLNAIIEYINNPVLHAVLDENDRFINKSLNALENLKELAKNTNRKVLGKHVKLFRYYTILRSLHAGWFLKICVFPFLRVIENNLYSRHPSLFLFDVYRLYYFISLR